MTLLNIGQPTTADKSNDLFPAEPTVEAGLAAIIEKHTEQVDDFDWSGDGSIVVEEQPSIAIYLNNRNHVVIRQRAYEEDSFVTIAPQNLMAVIDQLCDMAGVASVGKRRR